MYSRPGETGAQVRLMLWLYTPLGAYTFTTGDRILGSPVLAPDMNMATSALHLWLTAYATGNLLNLVARLEEGLNLLVDALVGFACWLGFTKLPSPRLSARGNQRIRVPLTHACMIRP